MKYYVTLALLLSAIFSNGQNRYPTAEQYDPGLSSLGNLWSYTERLDRYIDSLEKRLHSLEHDNDSLRSNLLMMWISLSAIGFMPASFPEDHSGEIWVNRNQHPAVWHFNLYPGPGFYMVEGRSKEIRLQTDWLPRRLRRRFEKMYHLGKYAKK